MVETKMTAENVLNNLYENALDERPTFTKAMLEHMRNEVGRIEKEALEWHRKHNGENLSEK